MDWVTWEPMSFPLPEGDLDAAGTSLEIVRLTAWVILVAAALIAVLAWRRRRVIRSSFWCATSGREVDVRLRVGRVLSCSAFEDPKAIACARPCRDRSYRVQWPPTMRLAVPDTAAIKT